MALKEFKYRGYTLNELKSMEKSKLYALAPSNIKRALVRTEGTLDKKVKRGIESNLKGEQLKKTLKTHRRDIIITPDMVGLKITVYNGKTFEPLDIKDEMLWHYLGEFIDTRKRPVHSKAGIGATRSSKNVGKK